MNAAHVEAVAEQLATLSATAEYRAEVIASQDALIDALIAEVEELRESVGVYGRAHRLLRRRVRDLTRELGRLESRPPVSELKDVDAADRLERMRRVQAMRRGPLRRA